MPETLGLIAGQGKLPILVAEGMRRAGHRVCCVGLRDQYDPALPDVCDAFRTVGVVRLGGWIRALRRWDVNEAIMVGAVRKTRAHDPLRVIKQMPDWRAAMVWYRRLRHDRRNAAVLAAVADELARNGITLIDSTTYIPDHLATVGVLTSVQPTAQQQADTTFGFDLLNTTVELDIGQSMAVRDRDVIAVEAVEGTDRMIDRAGELCRASGWTLIKTSKQAHDMRADVPTIGVETIERVKRAGGGCIAVGAGRVILLDKPAVIETANREGIAIIGVDTSS
ncbi:MAG: UDP-2,3-diacylglucosamine diphosphatase LpxI [Planctomycetota bacterium]